MFTSPLLPRSIKCSKHLSRLVLYLVQITLYANHSNLILLYGKTNLFNLKATTFLLIPSSLAAFTNGEISGLFRDKEAWQNL